MFYARLPFPKLSHPFRRVCVGIENKGGEKKRKLKPKQKAQINKPCCHLQREYKKVYYSATTDVAMARVVISYG